MIGMCQETTHLDQSWTSLFRRYARKFYRVSGFLKVSEIAEPLGTQSTLTTNHRHHDDNGGDVLGRLTLGRLVKVHKRLKKAFHHCSRAHALWIEAVRQAAWSEDVYNNYKSNG